MAQVATTCRAGVLDWCGLLWASIDNDAPRDPDQMSVAEPTMGGSVKILIAIDNVDALVRKGQRPSGETCLFPIMWGTGTGSEVMQRIAAPMVGGMISAPLLSMFVTPVAYLLMRRPRDHRVRGAPSASIGAPLPQSGPTRLNVM